MIRTTFSSPEVACFHAVSGAEFGLLEKDDDKALRGVNFVPSQAVFGTRVPPALFLRASGVFSGGVPVSGAGTSTALGVDGAVSTASGRPTALFLAGLRAADGDFPALEAFFLFFCFSGEESSCTGGAEGFASMTSGRTAFFANSTTVSMPPFGEAFFFCGTSM